jgi:predicted ATPase
MLREINEVLEPITSENALLLVLEDLHWADHSTVDLISALARRRAPAKLMVIGTYRPVDVIVSEHPLHALKQDLLVHQLCREIGLEPLGEGEVAEYLAAECSGASLPDGLASLLYQHSEGNPLFVVAALDHMSERGLISREKGRWQLRVALKGIDLEVPKSLEQMIEVQIERLSAEEQRVLEEQPCLANSFQKCSSSIAASAFPATHSIATISPQTATHCGSLSAAALSGKTTLRMNSSKRVLSSSPSTVNCSRA